MNYSYSALSPGGSGGFGGVDQHNRCCGNKAWCVKDICGIVCVVMTWLLILFAEFVVMRLILLPSNYTVFSTINMIVSRHSLSSPLPRTYAQCSRIR